MRIKTRRTKEDRELDAVFDRAFRVHASGIQFDVFDLSKIRADFNTLVAAGESPDAVMQKVASRYRKN